MNILICVYFRALFGGLHANVFSTARHCLRRGHHVTIVCREGPFREQLQAAGIETIATDYASTEDSVRTVLAESTRRYDVIHVHPFGSRKVGLQLAQELSLPLLLTYHGMYPDELDQHVDRYAAVVAVSQGIRDYLAALVPTSRQKLFVAPNGVDLGLFGAGAEAASHDAPARDKPRIALVTRLDHDKRFILDMALRGLRHCASAHARQVEWTIVGDGNELAAFQQEAAAIAEPADIPLTYRGWLHGQELAQAYRESDIVVAPGRCALEAMACGRPVIAIGSKEYVGLVTPETWQAGVYTNFGGLGQGLESYQEGRIESELSRLLGDPSQRAKLGELGAKLTSSFYDESAINEQLLALYGACAIRA